jgi:hypothetical protein
MTVPQLTAVVEWMISTAWSLGLIFADTGLTWPMVLLQGGRLFGVELLLMLIGSLASLTWQVASGWGMALLRWRQGDGLGLDGGMMIRVVRPQEYDEDIWVLAHCLVALGVADRLVGRGLTKILVTLALQPGVVLPPSRAREGFALLLQVVIALYHQAIFDRIASAAMLPPRMVRKLQQGIVGSWSWVIRAPSARVQLARVGMASTDPLAITCSEVLLGDDGPVGPYSVGHYYHDCTSLLVEEIVRRQAGTTGGGVIACPLCAECRSRACDQFLMTVFN